MSDAADRATRIVANLTDSAARRKVEAALAGEVPVREPTDEEGVVFSAEISTAIQEVLEGANYGAVLAARGITTVALNDDGEMVQYRPRGA